MFIEVEQMSPRLFTYICLKDLIYELKNKEALLVYPISGIVFPRALMGFKGLNKRIVSVNRQFSLYRGIPYQKWGKI